MGGNLSKSKNQCEHNHVTNSKNFAKAKRTISVNYSAPTAMDKQNIADIYETRAKQSVQHKVNQLRESQKNVNNIKYRNDDHINDWLN